MFCAFDGGRTSCACTAPAGCVFRDDPGFEARLAAFGEAGASRDVRRPAGVIVVDVARVSDSCGYAVPKMEFVEERDVLDSWSRTRGPDKLVEYRAAKNATSLDGLPALPV